MIEKIINNNQLVPEKETLTEEKLFLYLKSACGAIISKHLEDPAVTEIMANPQGDVWIEINGRMMKIIENLPIPHRERVINLVASNIKSIVNEQNPSVAAVMPRYNARFQGMIPPVVDQPAFVIRKHAARVIELQNYVEDRKLKALDAMFLKEKFLEKKNVLIVGGTGTGKTTFANSMLKLLEGTNDRVITIEDTPELQFNGMNKMALYTTSAYTWENALKDTLRLRPDRIIVGEIRDGVSALNLLSAWNTGHSGGLATIHANNALMGLKRLETLLATVSKNVPFELLANAVNIVVNMQRNNSGRFIKEVIQIEGYNMTEKKYILDSSRP